MSVVRYTTVELSDIVKEANLIVEVEKAEPFTEEVAVKTEDPEVPGAPFKKKGYVFKVKNSLKNTANIQVPQTIQVPEEGWRRSLSQHKEMYGGDSKSYGVKQYKTDVRSMKDADILFLHHFQGTFELELKNSFESADAIEKITMLLKAL